MKPRKPSLSPARQWSLAHRRGRRTFSAWPAAVRGMVWMVLGGLLFSILNTIARNLTLHLDVYQSQFLRYLFGLLVMLPLGLSNDTRLAWMSAGNGCRQTWGTSL